MFLKVLGHLGVIIFFFSKTVRLEMQGSLALFSPLALARYQQCITNQWKVNVSFYLSKHLFNSSKFVCDCSLG